MKKPLKKILNKILTLIAIAIFIFLIVKYIVLLHRIDNEMLNITYTREQCQYYVNLEENY